jgi:lipopolysaccharide assembly outer membrane protein LptD (OstA)
VRYLILSILFLIIASTVFSQQNIDSLLYTPLPDTTKKITDTTVSDNGLDDIIEYSAKDSAVFDIEGKKLYLYNDAVLKHKEYTLKAARIILYRETSIMEAYGIPDTANPGKYTGTPIFLEGDKRYDAFKIVYNFNTRRGNITMGSTELEGGYYLGEKIKKVDEGTYFIKHGRYTTCDLPDPHFYFGSPKMKVLQGDKVIGEPVYLYIDEVPVFAIPFGIFPNHTGRSSGIITPVYGEDATYGFYLARLGYFWAINDYIDLALQGSYYTKGRIDLIGRFRYALKYKYNGQLDIGASRIRLGEENDLDKQYSDEWHIGATHSQAFNPTTTLTANVNLLSSKTYYDNASNNYNDLLQQNAISNITLTKAWDGTPNSISLNYYRDQNLQNGEVTENIPQITFTNSQTFPFRGKNTDVLKLKWYESISYGYNASLLNVHTKKLHTDSYGNETFLINARGGLKQILTIAAPVSTGFFNISPFFSYNEVWHNKYVTKSVNPYDSTVITSEHSGFKTFRYFNTGISFNTRIIGLFNMNLLGIKGFRHTINPNITFSYQPDFRKPQWNIYESYTDAIGNQIQYNKFEREVYGSVPGGEAKVITFVLGNIFELKTRSKRDSVDNKFQLLNVDAGMNYNFVADSLKLSELGITFRTQIANILNLGGTTSFNFYKYVQGAGRVNQFLWTTDKRIADLTSFNINVSTSIQSSSSTEGFDTNKTKQERTGIYSNNPPDFSVPWQLTINYNYGFSKPNPSVINKLSNLSGNLSFSLTKNWKFTVTGSFDIFEKQLSAPLVKIYRDLHCWEINFSWIPLGLYRGFQFELRLKAPQLQDVKVTKQSNYRFIY